MNIRTPTQYKPTESNVNINLSKSKAEAKILVHPKMETVCVLNNTEESSQPNFSGESKLHPSPPQYVRCPVLISFGVNGKTFTTFSWSRINT